MLCNPHNPVGQCYSAEVIWKIAAFCHRCGLHLVSDEVYALSVLEGSAIPFVSVLEALGIPASEGTSENEAQSIHPSRVHQVWSVSKDSGSSGVRMVSDIVHTSSPSLSAAFFLIRALFQASVVSQANPLVLAGVKTSTYWQTSALSNLYVTALLGSAELPSLIKLNVKRLTHGYNVLTSTLREWDVDFIPVSAGLMVFAKLAKNAVTWQDNRDFVKKLREKGVKVTPGRMFGGVKNEMGWVRITFSVPEEVLRNALSRIEKTLRS